KRSRIARASRKLSSGYVPKDSLSCLPNRWQQKCHAWLPFAEPCIQPVDQKKNIPVRKTSLHPIWARFVPDSKKLVTYHLLRYYGQISIFLTLIENMPRKPPIVFPQEQRLLSELGERLRLARKRRKLSNTVV